PQLDQRGEESNSCHSATSQQAQTLQQGLSAPNLEQEQGRDLGAAERLLHFTPKHTASSAMPQISSTPPSAFITKSRMPTPAKHRHPDPPDRSGRCRKEWRFAF